MATQQLILTSGPDNGATSCTFQSRLTGLHSPSSLPVQPSLSIRGSILPIPLAGHPRTLGTHLLRKELVSTADSSRFTSYNHSRPPIHQALNPTLYRSFCKQSSFFLGCSAYSTAKISLHCRTAHPRHLAKSDKPSLQLRPPYFLTPIPPSSSSSSPLSLDSSTSINRPSLVSTE